MIRRSSSLLPVTLRAVLIALSVGVVVFAGTPLVSSAAATQLAPPAAR